MSSSSDKKTIQFNPDLFKIPEKRATRRRSPEQKEIKVRSGKTSRSHLIRQIRNLQEERYKRMQENPNSAGESIANNNINNNISNSSLEDSSQTDDFENNFENSLQFLKNMVEQEHASAAAKPPQHNTTLKHPRPPPIVANPPAALFGQNHNMSNNSPKSYDLGVSSPQEYEIDLEVPSALTAALNTPPIKLTPRPPTPQYGCLKNGNLPTYRTFHNTTQRNVANMLGGGVAAQQSPTYSNLANSLTTPTPSSTNTFDAPLSNGTSGNTLLEQIKRHNAVQDNMRGGGVGIPKRPQKQRRIVKRTFRVGKSKVYPRVGVLVANKTIRNNLANRVQDIKQTPIEQVKRDLVKRGLIKVGSSAPNDVLRKMYESVSMVCGEVHNHNSENLLYNYLNADII